MFGGQRGGYRENGDRVGRRRIVLVGEKKKMV